MSLRFWRTAPSPANGEPLRVLQLHELLGYRATPPPAHPTALPRFLAAKNPLCCRRSSELKIHHGLALDCETLPPGASITFLAFSWKIGFAILQFCRGRNERTLAEAVTRRIWMRCKVCFPESGHIQHLCTWRLRWARLWEGQWGEQGAFLPPGDV